MILILSCVLFSAELILQENIDYNDLVNSIQNENLLINDEQNNKKAREVKSG